MQLAKKGTSLQLAKLSVRSPWFGSRGRHNSGVRHRNVELAELVYDSSRAQVCGVRSLACARQLLYKSGTVCIDLHVEPKPGSESIVVVGQLLDQLRPTHRVSNVSVSLFSHGAPVSSTKTNDFGEFDFAFDAPEDVHIAFGMGGERTLVVPLPDTSLKT